MPLSDVVWFGLAVSGLLLLVGLGEGLRRMGADPTASRRVVHVGVGGVVAATPYLFSGPLAVYLLAACFVAGNAIARIRQWWPGIHAGRPDSIGTVTFPLAVFPALALAWPASGNAHPWGITVAFLILAVADPIAAWVGVRYGHTGHVGKAQKSWIGSCTFAVVAWGVSYAALVGTGVASGETVAGVSLVLAVTTTMAEALGGKGWDNLFIVVTAVVALVAWAEGVADLPILVMATGAGVGFAVISWRVRWLSRSGALAGGLFATSLLALGGAAWTVPAVVFFVLSSLLSRVGRGRKRPAAARSEKGSVRDAGQVYANGAVGWVLLVAYAVAWNEAALYGGFLGAFAAAAADTWATELGTMARRQPRLLTTGRRVPPGTSGAVSGWGTLASAAGAATVALSAWAVAGTPWVALGTPAGVGLVVIAGVSGAMVDSVLGATLQAQYTGPSGEWVEQPSGSLARGVRWITNDRVNIACTGWGALIGGIGAALLGV